MRKKIIFMGTPPFSVVALEALASQHDILCVYSQPPRPAKRGKKLQKTAVHEKAEALGIPVRTPTSLKDEIPFLQSLKLDAAVVVAYGLLLPQAVLDIPAEGCYNIHASLLPRWRGAAPIERAIMAGDTETGITIMQMDAGLDTGDMLAIDTVPITATSTAQNLHDELAVQGVRLIQNVLAEKQAPTKQPTEGITYAKKLKKEEGLIDWVKPAAVLDRQIRAIRSHFEYEGERIRVLEAVPLDHVGDVGKVLDTNLTIGCGEGSLRLVRLQRAGKNPVSAADFLRGYDVPVGISLGADT
ncbi:MAG: methionyl-tRNA formyltransferase [Alphaproteobacteria bacterium]